MTNCENCLKKNLWRNTGKRNERGAVIRQCKNCGHEQAEPPPQGEQYKRPSRWLYYDIEMTKMTVQLETFSLRLKDNLLSWKDVIKPPIVICWAAAWITPKATPENLHIVSDVITPDEIKKQNDKRTLSGLWELMNCADALVGHNIKSFDTKKAHLRFLLNKMGAPDLSVKQIDTLTLAKKHFRNDSNALGYWLERLEKSSKDRMESEDWDLCKAGDEKALRKMRRYNKNDVRGGAEVFLEFRKYVESGGGVIK